MGWTYMPMPREGTTEWLKKELTFTRKSGATNKALATAIVERKEAYAAVETIHADGRREVWAAVFLLDYKPRDREGFTFGYKDMTESMGPVVCRCPSKILDMLTETDNEYANSWRQRCRTRLLLRENNRLAHGDIIKLDRQLNYNGYGSFDTFRAVIANGKVRFHALDPETLRAQFLCRIPNWREETFERIQPEDRVVADGPCP